MSNLRSRKKNDFHGRCKGLLVFCNMKFLQSTTAFILGILGKGRVSYKLKAAKHLEHTVTE